MSGGDENSGISSLMWRSETLTLARLRETFQSHAEELTSGERTMAALRKGLKRWVCRGTIIELSRRPHTVTATLTFLKEHRGAMNRVARELGLAYVWDQEENGEVALGRRAGALQVCGEPALAGTCRMKMVFPRALVEGDLPLPDLLNPEVDPLPDAEGVLPQGTWALREGVLSVEAHRNAWPTGSPLFYGPDSPSLLLDLLAAEDPQCSEAVGSLMASARHDLEHLVSLAARMRAPELQSGFCRHWGPNPHFVSDQRMIPNRVAWLAATLFEEGLQARLGGRAKWLSVSQGGPLSGDPLNTLHVKINAKRGEPGWPALKLLIERGRIWRELTGEERRYEGPALPLNPRDPSPATRIADWFVSSAWDLLKADPRLIEPPVDPPLGTNPTEP